MIKQLLLSLLLFPLNLWAQPLTSDVDWGARIFAQAGYYQQSQEIERWAIPGFMTGGESVPHDQGLQLFHGEVAFFATLEEVLSSNITIGSHGTESPEIEELWLQPWLAENWQLRIGRQLIDIGLYNGVHDHEWRFIDATLSQSAFLGGQYSDDAVSVAYQFDDVNISTWIGRGTNFPASVAQNSASPNAYGLALQWLWLGEKSSFLINSSLSHFSATDRNNSNNDHHRLGNADLSFTGDTNLLTLGGEWQLYQGGWQVEWMASSLEGDLVDSLQRQSDLLSNYYGVSSEWFWQWADVEAALRYEWLNSHNQLSATSAEFESVLDSDGHNPQRFSVVVNWAFAESQWLRLQANYDQLSDQDESAFWLVYQGELSW